MFSLIFLCGFLGLVLYEVAEDDDEPQPESDPNELAYDGSEILEGTEGDDALPADQNPDLSPDVIRLLGGDDSAVVEYPFGTQVFGGEGDDHLVSTAVVNTLDGGAGDDTLEGIDATRLLGGEGDDEITVELHVDLNDQTAVVEGGEGDDSIMVFADAGLDHPDTGGVSLAGGEGADRFELQLTLHNSEDDLQGSDDLLESDIGRIEDFDPAEDALVVSLDRSAESADRDVEIGFVQSEENGVYTTEVTLTFEATASATRAETSFAILSTAPFAIEDIQFVGVSSP
ncbi:hypothetical protein [Shimia sediminis]|uniref:hypothetical protein n=1 Tax=Shimia sediminis TaxID=2497945 RepID=UPI000F8CA405|nr:hypothetical protein [Shimia sediminis]